MEPELTPSEEGAAQLHETFLIYTKVGFTEDQALKLVAYLLAAMAQGDQGETQSPSG